MILRGTHPCCQDEGQEKLTICQKKQKKTWLLLVSLLSMEMLFFPPCSCRINKDGKKNHRQQRVLKLNVSTLRCEPGEAAAAAAKDSYEIQLTHRRLSFSPLP